MPKRRKSEVFSAECAICRENFATIGDAVCPACDVVELDMANPQVARRAKALGVSSVPAIVIDGRLAGCCAGRGPELETLKIAGLGQPLR